MSKKVLIVHSNQSIEDMFTEAGWTVVDKMKEADLVQFTGGEDVSPMLYGQSRHETTFFNPNRDRAERLVFLHALENKKPMAGICRGGQFLNIMCEGDMWQDVDNHTRPHKVFDLIEKFSFWASSTHHQMMIPNINHGVTIATAGQSTFKVKVPWGGKELRVYSKNSADTEVVYYNNKNVLCFQPHPEHDGYTLLKYIYFHYINKYLFKTVDEDLLNRIRLVEINRSK